MYVIFQLKIIVFIKTHTKQSGSDTVKNTCPLCTFFNIEHFLCPLLSRRKPFFFFWYFFFYSNAVRIMHVGVAAEVLIRALHTRFVKTFTPLVSCIKYDRTNFFANSPTDDCVFSSKFNNAVRHFDILDGFKNSLICYWSRPSRSHDKIFRFFSVLFLSKLFRAKNTLKSDYFNFIYNINVSEIKDSNNRQ